MSPTNFHFITPVWGEEYTQQFLKVSLPCQLSPGNLGFFRGRSCHDRYNIFTTAKDAVTIRQAPILAILKKIMAVEIHLIDDVIEDLKRNKVNKYDMLTICHSRGIEVANKHQAAFISLCADMLFSDGSFASLVKLAESGKNLVAVGSYRVSSDTAVPVLLDKFYSKKDSSITISPRELVQLSLVHMHHHVSTGFVNGPRFSDVWPAHIYWNVEGEGIIQRGIHLHPILINPRTNNAVLDPASGMGIDGYDYMQRAVPDYNDVYVVDDSDELTLLSLHPQEVHTPPYPYKFSSLQVASWIKKHCSAYHVKFLNTKIRFHAAEISNKWKKVDKDSDRVVKNILACLDFFDKVPEVCDEIEMHRVECNSQSDTRIAEIFLLRKDNLLTHIRLGIELKNQGKLKEAADVFLHVIKMAPQDPFPYNHLGIILYQLKDYRRAEKTFLSAIKASPSDVDAYVNLAELYSSENRYHEAIQYLKQAAKLAPHDNEILTMLSTCGERLST